MGEPTTISREAARVTHTRGASLKLYRTNLRSLVDETTWIRVLRDCSEPVAEFLCREVDPDEWIPTEWLTESRGIYLKRTGHNLWAARGGMMARPLYELGKDHGWFAGKAPSQVLLDYPKLWNHIHKGGQVEVALLEGGRAELVIWADIPYSEYLAEYLPRFFTSLLQLRGAGLVRVRYEPPGPEGWAHRYHCSWHESAPGDAGLRR